MPWPSLKRQAAIGWMSGWGQKQKYAWARCPLAYQQLTLIMLDCHVRFFNRAWE
jgi:hypothetical protein